MNPSQRKSDNTRSPLEMRIGRLAFLLSLLISGSAGFCASPTDLRHSCPRAGVQALNADAFYGDEMIPSSSSSQKAKQITLKEAKKMKLNTLELARRNDYSTSIEIIRDLVSMLDVVNGPTKEELASLVDDAMRSFTNLAFSKPYGGVKANTRVKSGLKAIELQLSASDTLPSPYADVPRETVLGALRAVSAVLSNHKKSEREDDANGPSTEAAFRLLQRLLTGNGVRTDSADDKTNLTDRDFNAVLNAMCNVGRMDIAHRIVALQERTAGAPPIDIITYSILLKGYGRQHDVHNVEMTLSQAEKNGIIPDTIMLNTVIDAFINCDNIDKAKLVFKQMLTNENADDDGHGQAAVPNVRTYNTMLKGFARRGLLDEALALTQTMRTKELWDDVTTNTLVSVAIAAGDFDRAERIISENTRIVAAPEDSKSKRSRQHPNVEAYTELLDGYAKAGDLEKALSTLKLMRNRKVQPNEYTYSCVVGALARAKKVKQAHKLFGFMAATGVKPTAVVYNSFISGLTDRTDMMTTIDMDQPAPVVGWDDEDIDYEKAIGESIKVLRAMISAGVRPNISTVSILLEAFAKSSRPKTIEAQALVTKFEKDGIIPRNHKRIKTAMIRVLGTTRDLKSALAEFRSISYPDVIAVNALLDVACSCGETQIAFSTFKHVFEESPPPFSSIEPDVITYTILIKSKLKQKTIGAFREAQKLYADMRSRGVFPDITLINVFLNVLLDGGKIGLKKKDIQFTFSMLKDAENLPWKEGEFQQRKQAARAIMTARMSEVWKEDEEYYGMSSMEAAPEDKLFKQKGWNQIDSGFRLWGGGIDFDGMSPSMFASEEEEDELDEFLASKGWNDVDSGFRLI